MSVQTHKLQRVMRVRRHFCLIFATLAALALGGCGDTTSELISKAEQPAATCHTNAECSTEKPACETSTGRCVECLAHADCPGPDRKLCNTESHRCVECLSDSHCDTIAESCSLLLGICAPPCASGGGCPLTDPFCDTSVGFCVECLADRDCQDAGQPFCRGSQCTQ